MTRKGARRYSKADRSLIRRLGAAVAERRRSIGVSQETLAAAIGVTEGQLGRYEQGRSGMDAVLLVKLGEALRCSPGAFFDGLGNGR
jgi:transcriptional regulator with XRE-family HTH domain